MLLLGSGIIHLRSMTTWLYSRRRCLMKLIVMPCPLAPLHHDKEKKKGLRKKFLIHGRSFSNHVKGLLEGRQRDFSDFKSHEPRNSSKFIQTSMDEQLQKKKKIETNPPGFQYKKTTIWFADDGLGLYSRHLGAAEDRKSRPLWVARSRDCVRWIQTIGQKKKNLQPPPATRWIGRFWVDCSGGL